MRIGTVGFFVRSLRGAWLQCVFHEWLLFLEPHIWKTKLETIRRVCISRNSPDRLPTLSSHPLPTLHPHYRVCVYLFYLPWKFKVRGRERHILHPLTHSPMNDQHWASSKPEASSRSPGSGAARAGTGARVGCWHPLCHCVTMLTPNFSPFNISLLSDLPTRCLMGEGSGVGIGASLKASFIGTALPLPSLVLEVKINPVCRWCNGSWRPVKCVFQGHTTLKDLEFSELAWLCSLVEVPARYRNPYSRAILEQRFRWLF